MESFQMRKYPRTPHIEGSRLQPGDEDLSQISFEEIKNRHLVIEEKCDGANSAVSFDANGELLLQSRGHYLTGGYRERHYNLMKQWANAHRDEFFQLLGTKYIMYGEWVYAKHIWLNTSSKAGAVRRQWTISAGTSPVSSPGWKKRTTS